MYSYENMDHVETIWSGQRGSMFKKGKRSFVFLLPSSVAHFTRSHSSMYLYLKTFPLFLPPNIKIFKWLFDFNFVSEIIQCKLCVFLSSHKFKSS